MVKKVPLPQNPSPPRSQLPHIVREESQVVIVKEVSEADCLAK